MSQGKQHIPTEETTKLVAAFAAVGVPTKYIAAHIGINESTLFVHYQDVMSAAQAEICAKIGNTLVHKALDGDTTALIFLCKTRLRYREIEREKDQATLDQEAKDKQVPDLLKQIVDKLPD